MGFDLSLIPKLLGYDFMQRALLGGSLVALCCALLGVFLVLRKYSLIGDGLGHVSLLTTALGLVLGLTPLAVNVPLVVLGAFLILAIHKKARLYGDAAIGLVSSLSVAGAVLVVSLVPGFNVDLMSYLFGSLLLISGSDLWVSVALTLGVMIFLWIFRHDLVSLTFDEDFARVQGVPVARAQHLLLVLTGVTVSLGIRIVGTMMVSSLLILPALTGLQWAKSFRGALVVAGASALGSIWGGILLSAAGNWPPGAVSVLLAGVLFLLSTVCRWWPRGSH